MRDRCEQGVCKGRDARIFTETFEHGLGDWEVGNGYSKHSLWQVGPARASNCDDGGTDDVDGAGEDPAVDHTPGSGNGVAGVVIGGCRTRGKSRGWDCLRSPKIDISGHRADLELSFWRHLHSPPNRISGRRGVLNRISYITEDGEEHVLEAGWHKVVNDREWTRQSYLIDHHAGIVQLSICYRAGHTPESFAGWSLDDVRVRNQGCDTDQ